MVVNIIRKLPNISVYNCARAQIHRKQTLPVSNYQFRPGIEFASHYIELVHKSPYISVKSQNFHINNTIIYAQLKEKTKARDLRRARTSGEVHTEFWWRNLMEKDHLENLAVNGSIILKRILQEMGWIHLAQVMDNWSILVKFDNEPSGCVKHG